MKSVFVTVGTTCFDELIAAVSSPPAMRVRRGKARAGGWGLGVVPSRPALRRLSGARPLTLTGRGGGGSPVPDWEQLGAAGSPGVRAEPSRPSPCRRCGAAAASGWCCRSGGESWSRLRGAT